jgi:hypothetical protein
MGIASFTARHHIFETGAQWRCRYRAGRMRSNDLPRASPFVKPKRRSAPEFHTLIPPSVSVTTSRQPIVTDPTDGIERTECPKSVAERDHGRPRCARKARKVHIKPRLRPSFSKPMQSRSFEAISGPVHATDLLVLPSGIEELQEREGHLIERGS